jgi:hypothetical protein
MTKATKIQLTADELKAKRSAAALKAAATRKAKKEAEVAAALAAVAAAEAAEVAAKAAAQQAMAELVEEVAAPKKASGWIKASVDYIKSQVEVAGAAITFETKGKKVWIAVNGKDVFWVFKVERAEQLVAKLTAA